MFDSKFVDLKICFVCYKYKREYNVLLFSLLIVDGKYGIKCIKYKLLFVWTVELRKTAPFFVVFFFVLLFILLYYTYTHIDRICKLAMLTSVYFHVFSITLSYIYNMSEFTVFMLFSWLKSGCSQSVRTHVTHRCTFVYTWAPNK